MSLVDMKFYFLLRVLSTFLLRHPASDYYFINPVTRNILQLHVSLRCAHAPVRFRQKKATWLGSGKHHVTG